MTDSVLEKQSMLHLLAPVRPSHCLPPFLIQPISKPVLPVSTAIDAETGVGTADCALSFLMIKLVRAGNKVELGYSTNVLTPFRPFFGAGNQWNLQPYDKSECLPPPQHNKRRRLVRFPLLMDCKNRRQ